MLTHTHTHILNYSLPVTSVRAQHAHWHTHGKRLNCIITPFAPAYLSQFRRTFVLRAVEEVVGVLKATGEGEVSLVALVSIMAHFLLVEWQHFRHLSKMDRHREIKLQQRKSTNVQAASSRLGVALPPPTIGRRGKQCNLQTRSSPCSVYPPAHVSVFVAARSRKQE